MSDTTLTPNPATTNGPAPDSTVWGVSIRAWLAIFLVVTLCANHLFITLAVLIEAVKSKDFAKVGTYTTIAEPLYSVTIAVVAYYFGQQKNK